jgi:hypothetical protein
MLEKIQFKILEYNRYLLNKLYDKGEKRLNKYGLSLEIALPATPPSGLISLLESVEWLLSYGLIEKEGRELKKSAAKSKWEYIDKIEPAPLTNDAHEPKTVYDDGISKQIKIGPVTINKL